MELFKRLKDFIFVFLRQSLSVSPDCPGTHFLNQAGLGLRNSPDSVSPSAEETMYLLKVPILLLF